MNCKNLRIKGVTTKVEVVVTDKNKVNSSEEVYLGLRVDYITNKGFILKMRQTKRPCLRLILLHSSIVPVQRKDSKCVDKTL